MDVGVIGVGVMGRNHARIYNELKEVGVTYVFDLDAKSAEEVAAQTGAEVCSSIDEMLRKVDLVSLVVPTRYHFETAKQVIASGVHTLIEKPICATVSEAEQLIQEIPEGIVVGVGHIERFNPIVPEIQRIAKAPRYIAFHRHNPASGRITDASIVEDLMIHDIDILVNAFFPDSEYSFSVRGSKDIAHVLGGVDSTSFYLSASRKSAKKIRSIYIEEEERTVEGDFMTQEIYVYRKPETYDQTNGLYRQENIIEKVLVNKVEPLKVELQAFVRAARDGRMFDVTPEEGLTNLRICEAIQRGISR
ncbi:putative dehydrogenase [Methanocalculus alkaliphilus]|uniref:Gfo/Idh/MocA family protein n=1 Tax=Methanocalculus alkaliphilus TaxID=768730 RepID=UPI00209D8E12|nr:Gfo/Idh/MocA family oxidoreductase [Methanocalculus alkaliphilus]MCP1716191.1 putative dehydrogenase [Methanocalculus alkaliphilus]